jgi:hypothetical protein
MWKTIVGILALSSICAQASTTRKYSVCEEIENGPTYGYVVVFNKSNTKATAFMRTEAGPQKLADLKCKAAQSPNFNPSKGPVVTLRCRSATANFDQYVFGVSSLTRDIGIVGFLAQKDSTGQIAKGMSNCN